MHALRFAAAALALAGAASAQTVLFQSISTGFNNPIGIDEYEPTNTLVVSVNYATGSPVALEKILQNGTHVAFSTLAGVTDEVKIATIRSGAVAMGGFAVGDLYVGNGVDGEIVKVNSAGTITDPWVSLPGASNGLMRGSLYHDRTGVFGGDLIVCTTTGQVWRITSAGTTSATPLANVGTHLEGLCTIPNDVPKYGPLAGKIVAGAEQQGLLYAIDTFGTVTTHDFDVDIEDIDLIPLGANFFGVNFGTARILGVAAGAFNSIAGDILLTQESHTGSGLYRLHWNSGSSAFEVTELGIASGSAVVGQWEHVTFTHAGVDPLPAAPITGINKDLINSTGTTANEIDILIQGVYPTVKSHYDGGFPNFSIIPQSNTTIFKWSGMNVPNNGLVHVGVELWGPSIKFMSIAWRFNGALVGCARQVNTLYGTHSSGTHKVEYENSVLSCASPTLYAGALTIEYYDVAPDLATLNPQTPRNPVWIEHVGAAPVMLTAGASQLVQVPVPPGMPQFAMLDFKVSTDPLLASSDTTHDFLLVTIEQPITSVPTTYCTSGTTTNGCVPSISATANPSLIQSPACNITVANVEGQKVGVLFYGINNAGFSPVPWGIGSSSFLCVKAPTQRTLAQNSGGTLGLCDGSFGLNWDAFQNANPGALGNPWSAGQKVFIQAWFRDPPAVKTTNLSHALEMTYQ